MKTSLLLSHLYFAAVLKTSIRRRGFPLTGSATPTATAQSCRLNPITCGATLAILCFGTTLCRPRAEPNQMLGLGFPDPNVADLLIDAIGGKRHC